MTERNPELLARAFHIQYANPNPPVKRLLPLVFSLLALPAAAAQTGHAVYRPGLTPARIPSPAGLWKSLGLERRPTP